MLPDERDSEWSLSAYLRVLRRWSWAILLTAILASLAAAFISRRQPVSYQASAQVLIRLQNLALALQHVTDPAAVDAVRTMDTAAQLARTPDVARRTIAAAGLNEYPSDFLGSSSVSEDPNSNILTFSVTDREEARAIRLATEYATQFASYQNELESSSLQDSLRSTERQLSRLVATGQEHSAQYQSLLGVATQLRTMQTLQTSRAIVVRRPGGAGKTQSSPIRAGILGALLGIALGMAITFLAEALDTRVRSEEMIRSTLALPLLGRVARPSPKLRRKNRLSAFEVTDPQAETYRMIAMKLKLETLKSPAKTIMVSSALPGEGKTTTVANLAVVLAQSGNRVSLIDLDLRSPSLHRAFDVPQAPGVTDVVLGRARIERTMAAISIDGSLSDRLPPPPSDVRTHDSSQAYGQLDAANSIGITSPLPTGSLYVVSAGSSSTNMSEFLPLERVAALLSRLADRSDVVLIDCPPLLVSGFALGLTEHVDGLLLVARLKLLRTNALRDLKRALDSIPTKKLGFILAGVTSKAGDGLGRAYAAAQPQSPDSDSDRSEREESAPLRRIL